jgi:SAM-dependent methyltransferase
MMDQPLAAIAFLAVFFIVALASRQIGAFFSRLKLPLITGFLVTGIMAGPYVLKIVSPEKIAKLRFVDELALAYIAFAAGSELVVRQIKSRLKAIRSANPGASGVGLDVDAAAARQARENILKWGLQDSFRIHQGDIRHFPGEISGAFDLITLFNILYYFEDEDRVELLHKVRSLLSPQGILAIAMNCHSQGTDVGAANLNIVTCSLKGLTPLPSREDIVTLLKRCAFRRVETHRFMPASTFYGFVAHNCGP